MRIHKYMKSSTIEVITIIIIITVITIAKGLSLLPQHVIHSFYQAFGNIMQMRHLDVGGAMV